MASNNRKFVTERALRSNSDLSEESDTDKGMVANVNTNNNVKRKRKNKDTGTSEHQGKKHKSKGHNKNRLKSKEDTNNQTNKAEVRFVEDERLIEMSVRPGEDEFTEENEEQNNDQEESDGPPELDEQESSDEGLIESDSEQMDEEVSFNFNKEMMDRNQEERKSKDQLNKIDQEMKQKLIELKSMMEKGGLKESANILANFPLLNEEKKDARQNEQTPSNGNQGGNLNVNNVNVKVTDDLVAGVLKGKSNSMVSKSLETIYEAAVPKRGSSSSEDELLVNSSDDSLNASHLQDRGDFIGQSGAPSDKQIEDFIVDTRKKGEVRSRVATMDEMTQRQQPSTSRQDVNTDNLMMTTEEKIQNMIRDAERAKAKIFATQGNSNDKLPSAFVDESYIVVGAHLDETMINKIIKGDYVEFGKLLPRDRVVAEEDGRLEMYCKNGRTFWSPVSNTISINSFAKWEQAFRVFSNIYSKANPSRAAELIEYNHIIHTISQAYVWDNVYLYDKEFRLHMARNPFRSWSMILQQAWSLRLKDRIMNQNTWANSYPSNNHNGNKNNQALASKFNEPCRRFNRGKCNFGPNCKYEHRCSYCYKFGHSSVNCRKALGDRERKNGNGSVNNNHGDRSHANQNNTNGVQESNSNQPTKN